MTVTQRAAAEYSSSSFEIFSVCLRGWTVPAIALLVAALRGQKSENGV
jgi:hypothetical protein